MPLIETAQPAAATRAMAIQKDGAIVNSRTLTHMTARLMLVAWNT